MLLWTDSVGPVAIRRSNPFGPKRGQTDLLAEVGSRPVAIDLADRDYLPAPPERNNNGSGIRWSRQLGVEREGVQITMETCIC